MKDAFGRQSTEGAIALLFCPVPQTCNREFAHSDARSFALRICSVIQNFREGSEGQMPDFGEKDPDPLSSKKEEKQA